MGQKQSTYEYTEHNMPILEVDDEFPDQFPDVDEIRKLSASIKKKNIDRETKVVRKLIIDNVFPAAALGRYYCEIHPNGADYHLVMLWKEIFVGKGYDFEIRGTKMCISWPEKVVNEEDDEKEKEKEKEKEN